MVWKKAFDNGLVGGLAYQFGGVAGSFGTGSTETAALAYNGNKFSMAGFLTHADVAGLSNKTASLGGNYQFGDLRLNAGYFHYTAEQGGLGGRTDNAYTVSGKYAPSGPWDYELGYQVMKANNAAVNAGGNVLNAYAPARSATATATGKRSTLYSSVFYHFDKITEVYFAADYLKLGGGYKVGTTNGFKNQAEFGVGLRTRF